MSVTLTESQAIVEAAKAHAESIGVKVSIAVVDARGDVVAISRMDGAAHFTVDVARGKAMVSAMFGRPSSAFTDHATSPVFQSIDELHGGRLFYVQGAVPLLRDGERAGAVGVSGASAQQDEDAARAGLEAL